MTVDLHMHSTFSDGRLSPEELVELAARRGVRLMALTDHDEVRGNLRAAEACKRFGVNFIPGVEVSAKWRELSVHVVGLDIDPLDGAFNAKLEAVRAQRDRRAHRIADLLAKEGLDHAYEKLVDHTCRASSITRAHFARLLMHEGLVDSAQQAFDRYLGIGKPCYVAGVWPTVPEAVGMIQAAGGTAVIAHPGRVAVKDPAEIEELFDEFAAAGGGVIEVSSGSQPVCDTDRFATIARKRGFAASCGTDFHSQQGRRPLPGGQPRLPRSQTPVWLRFGYDLRGEKVSP